MKRLTINLFAFAAVVFGGLSLSAKPSSANLPVGCCYNDCMKHCVPEYGFKECDEHCNRRCEACGGS